MPERQNGYQALLVVSFGGPEGPDDVMPFLSNVLRGKNVPKNRMLEVAGHYERFGGVSPINAQNRKLVAAIETELRQHQMELPVYFGNRNWHPMLEDTLSQMKKDGIQKAIAFFTSVFSSYSGCRQYGENLQVARKTVGPGAPVIDRLRMCFNHPMFIAASSDRVRIAMSRIPIEEHARTQLVFTAHSIPKSAADQCSYHSQLLESSRLVAQNIDFPNWELVFQSRSGPPDQPWLEPDVCEHLEKLKATDIKHVVLMPIGFLSDHLEVLFDLDIEAREKCDELGIHYVRAKTVGTHPNFVSMIREILSERIGEKEKLAIGNYPASHDVCPADCCLPGCPPVRGRDSN